MPALVCSLSPALIDHIYCCQVGAMCSDMYDFFQRLTRYLLKCLDSHDQQLLLIHFMSQMENTRTCLVNCLTVTEL